MQVQILTFATILIILVTGEMMSTLFIFIEAIKAIRKMIHTSAGSMSAMTVCLAVPIAMVFLAGKCMTVEGCLNPAYIYGVSIVGALLCGIQYYFLGVLRDESSKQKNLFIESK